MQLRLRTKLTLVMTSLVLLVVVVLSGVFVVQLLEQVLQETDKRAREIANQVFEQARRASTNMNSLSTTGPTRSAKCAWPCLLDSCSKRFPPTSANSAPSSAWL